MLNNKIETLKIVKIKLENNIQTISGGIGLDESIAIRKESKNWPILFEFSQINARKAQWISDVAIVVRDNKNKLIIVIGKYDNLISVNETSYAMTKICRVIYTNTLHGFVLFSDFMDYVG